MRVADIVQEVLKRNDFDNRLSFAITASPFIMENLAGDIEADEALLDLKKRILSMEIKIDDTMNQDEFIIRSRPGLILPERKFGLIDGGKNETV
jgi:hypothetical protein